MTPRRFFSLRWKLVISLLLLSLAMSGLFAVFFQRYLLKRYDDARQETVSRYAQQINGLIRQQKKHLEQVASALPALSQVRAALAQHDQPALQARFDPVWSTFQLDLGLDGARFFDKQGRPLAVWEDSEQSHLPDWSAMLQTTLEREAPSSFVDCRHACRIYALAPVLVGGDIAGIFAVGATLAETVLSFRNTSHAEIAIFAHAETGGSPDPWVQRWGLQLQAASNALTTRALLQQLAEQTDLAGLLQGSRRFSGSNRTYQVAPIALEPDNQTPGMVLLTLEDISAGLADANDTVRRFLIMDLSAVMLYLTLITVMLGHALNRLLRTAKLIPLLGSGKFEALRVALQPRPHVLLHDEIDVLDCTAIELSRRLETLEHEISIRTESLKAALDAASIEKSFATRLLDNAQAIIVTSDQQGAIVSLNRYGQELSGFQLEDLIGRPLLGSPLFPAPARPIADRLKAIAQTHSGQLRHEADMHCRDAEPRLISWTHTVLDATPQRPAALLSVGLDISERQQHETRLAYLADHDPLTGCYNRRRFHAELKRLLDKSLRQPKRGALLYLDLDRFKYLNDTCGHQAGDSLLLIVTEQLRQLLRTSDIIARLGGDEFAILLLDADVAAAIEVAERINHQLETINFPSLGLTHRVSASIGIALFPQDGADARELLVNADLAMYQAKAKGRVCWHVFSAQEQARERLYEWVVWEERIQRGMAEDRFELYYQPVLSIPDHTVRHYEVLLRLRLDDGSLAPPSQFLEIAERGGLISELDRWVVRKALQRLEALPDTSLSFAVNLSGASIGSTKLLDDLRGFFAGSSLQPGRVIFEITETAAVADLTEARQFVNEVRGFGCLFALDDFGSGFASFFYLKQFPVDYVKIDGSFIRNLPANLDDQIFVRAMVEIARAYGKKTVAEFVEDQATLNLLRDYGVDYGQGYYIGKPAPGLLKNNCDLP
ncbi:MAG: EAL domain-containing protein [Methylococcaceae bacterium]|nr:MAG: EAL domain-containing protein [Methylococcaceae bacterium]